jgi:MoCo/4Fe-4S cofactor protein with predicted Tat translocation signal
MVKENLMPSKEDRHINFALMRDRVLSKEGGKEYWRSLEEMADSDEFNEFVHREYPSQAEVWDDPAGRRRFLKLMGASLALAGLGGCSYQPPEKIVPYVRQPEEIVPGKALYFATAMTLGGVSTGLLARSNEGRPTKLEGNPDHPDSLGATDIFAQASLLSLYDPDRSRTTTYREEERPWSTFLGEMRTALDQQREKGGAGLRILTETISSPTLASQLRAIQKEFPAARWYQYEPAARNSAHAGAMMAFGQPVNTLYNFDKADRILSLDSDFLMCGPGNLKYARDFMRRRRVLEGKTEMNRLYAVETTPTNTGAKADHRLGLRPSQMETFARAVAGAVGVPGANVLSAIEGVPAGWLEALARDLQQSRGRSIVIPGEEQSPAVHALAHAINDALGNVGQTVIYTDTPAASPSDHMQQLTELVRDIDGGGVELLVILGGNPVYNAPADLGFADHLMKVRLRVHLSLYKDETSELCHWHIPEAHYLESWGDTRAFDGTVSIIQPLIEPLYEGKTAYEMLAIFSNETDRKPYDIVRNFWQGQMSGAAGQGTGAAAQATGEKPLLTGPIMNGATDFEGAWRKVVHDGVIPNTALPPKTIALAGDWATKLSQTNSPQAPAPNSFEIVFRTDPSIHDGRFANNGWLQELPKPLTKLTWDNAALISPHTAKRLGVDSTFGKKGGDWNADMVDLKYTDIKYKGLTLRLPVWVMPGQPDNVLTVHLGYGRWRAGRVGGMDRDKPLGFNAYKIRTSDAPWFNTGLEVTPAGQQYSLATTQLHFNMENRDVVRSRTLKDYLENPHEIHESTEGSQEPASESSKENSMYPPYDYKNQGNGYAWGMSIDVTSCVGCNACVVACQAENNIPVVGKEQVQRSREMHWLRVDTYFKGEDENSPAATEFMPVPCMHCENAPCEPVCPVHATVHDAEGTNNMVYNRCVGTRYCSNNCPYKVRRFNFLLYQDWTTPTYQLMRNPEVTVRSRGVMEKCTYCIQRIQWGKIESEKEGRKVRDGEVKTACQAVCPTEAIIFGNINDEGSGVARLKREPRNYSLLADLNTQPRTTYLAGLRNPNEEITEKA